MSTHAFAPSAPGLDVAVGLHSDITELRAPRAKDSCAILVEDLSVRYRDHQALADVSLVVCCGRTMAFVGPSGCGKTTLLKCLNRLNDLTSNCRVSGKIIVQQQDILAADVDVTALRRKVGMVFQRPNPFPFSIYKNLELPLREHGVPRHAIPARVQGALEAVGLWSEVKDRLNAPAYHLSGGQQQRLCIARALALEPEIILLDEPCSSLDPISCASIEELIHNLRGKYTVVIVTHNLGQARRLADDVAFFWVNSGSGQLVEQGPAREVFENPKSDLTAAYLRGAAG